MYAWLFRHTLWRVWEWHNRFGILNQMQELQHAEYDADTIRAGKERQLRKLLRHAYEEVPLYRKRFEEKGITEFSDFELRDLKDLPILTVEDLQHRGGDLTADNACDWRYGYSSGSTGEPKQYKIDNSALSWAYASMYRFWGWHGWELGQKWGHMKSDSMHVSLAKKLKSLLFRVLWMPARTLDAARMMDYVKKIRNANIQMLRANPSIAYLLADYLLQHEINNLQIPIVQTHGATLFPEWRKTIETAFQGKVVDGYGGEGMNICHQCELTEGYHVSEKTIVEAEGGQLLLTNLVNYAQPFIRYQIGDMGELSTARCSCGRGHELVKRLIGRQTDLVKLPDGRVLIPHFWTHAFVRSCFTAFQVIQPDYTHLIIQVIPGPDYTPKEEVQIWQQIAETVGSQIKLLWIHVKTIPRVPSGKVRTVISEVGV